jgi:hypothetical protein
MDMEKLLAGLIPFFPNLKAHNNTPMATIPTALRKLLLWTEIVSLIISIFGYLFKVLHYPGGNELLMIGLLALASTYFLSGFVMVPMPEPGGEQKGLLDLMAIPLRKILFIGLSVFCIADLFGIMQFEGAREMMLIGIGTLVLGCFCSMALILAKRERSALLNGPFLRSVCAIVFFGISKIL